MHINIRLNWNGDHVLVLHLKINFSLKRPPDMFVRTSDKNIFLKERETYNKSIFYICSIILL